MRVINVAAAQMGAIQKDEPREAVVATVGLAEEHAGLLADINEFNRILSDEAKHCLYLTRSN